MSEDFKKSTHINPEVQKEWLTRQQFNQVFPTPDRRMPKTDYVLPDTATITEEQAKKILEEGVRRIQADEPFESKKLNTATKYDSGKIEWNLLPWDAVEEIIKVLQFGAGKYDPWNWAENGGFKFSRLFNSSMRHFIAWFWKREDKDPESGIHHLAHLGCNVLFLLHYALNGNKFKDNDNRRV